MKNRYEVALELVDGPIEIEVTAESEEHAEDVVAERYSGDIINIYSVELLGAA